MNKAQQELVNETLERLRAKDMPELKSARRLEAVLSEAAASGKLDGAGLKKATHELVAEADVPHYFSRSNDGRGDVAYTSGFALLFLLLILHLLLAMLDDDDDLGDIIRELIDRLLGRS